MRSTVTSPKQWAVMYQGLGEEDLQSFWKGSIPLRSTIVCRYNSVNNLRETTLKPSHQDVKFAELVELVSYGALIRLRQQFESVTRYKIYCGGMKRIIMKVS